MEKQDSTKFDRRELLNRRELLKVMSGGATLIGATVLDPARALGQACAPPVGVVAPILPTSPLIGGYTVTNPVTGAVTVKGNAFLDPLPIPTPLAPVPPPTVPWTDPLGTPISLYNPWQLDVLTDPGWQNPWGWMNFTPGLTPPVSVSNAALNVGGGLFPNPLFYKIRMVRAGGGFDALGNPLPHKLTSLPVLPINAAGAPVLPPATAVASGDLTRPGSYVMPGSWMSTFNGTFPGSMIVATYGQPCVVHFENLLNGYDSILARWNNPDGSEGADFGVPSTLTHLHNGHTSPESDGNPFQAPMGYDSFYAPNDATGRPPNGKWYYDNVYLNYPPDGDDREEQSFLWFHDHRMDNTSANVYSGLVGLYLLYDTKDTGDEKRGYHLPGVPQYTGAGKTLTIDYTKPIQYDIPLALYDCLIDDGVTPHMGEASQTYPLLGHGMMGMETPPQDFCTHPTRWGQTFFGHFPGQGFVGDVFTVNGVAYPVLHVSPRRYRLRFLDCSISRWYNFQLMTSVNGPVSIQELMAQLLAAGQPAPPAGMTGQYQLPDGVKCMDFYQVASEGGLLPRSIQRPEFDIAPAKRREFVVDFHNFAGQTIYLVNTLQMDRGRQPTPQFAAPVDALGNPILDANGCPLAPVPNPGFFANYKAPVLKIVVDLPAVPDNSADPAAAPLSLRAVPPFPKSYKNVPFFGIDLKRGSGGWQIWEFDATQGPAGPLLRGNFFDPVVPFVKFPKGSVYQWIVRNGAGGWVHPLHIHQEEHRVLSRAVIQGGEPSLTIPSLLCSPLTITSVPLAPEDIAKEDVVALHPNEAVTIVRHFRSFTGKYVCHCHNLAHEDHAMMFGWQII